MAWHMGTIRPTLRFDLAGKRGCRVVSGATFCHLNELKGTVLGACHPMPSHHFVVISEYRSRTGDRTHEPPRAHTSLYR